MPIRPSHGDGPVRASAFTWAGGAAAGGGAGETTAGVPDTLLSLWASCSTTAAEGAAAVVDVDPVLRLRPLNSSRLTPSATALAELAPLSVWPSATMMVDSRGVPCRMVTVSP